LNRRHDVVIDDHLLLRILLDDEPTGLRRAVGAVFTTGLWYHRLCRALASTAVTGPLSRRLGAADPTFGATALRSVTDLPETIGVLSFRTLAWPMARLVSAQVRLNLLSLEALAAAEELGAELCLATQDENPTLLGAAAARGLPIRLIAD